MRSDRKANSIVRVRKDLRSARVHVCGTGRIGSSVALNLACSGVGYVSANDPQRIEEENVAQYIFTRLLDIGKAKVYALARFFDGRADFVFEPVLAPNESTVIDSYVAAADAIVSCANTKQARLAAEGRAVQLSKPIIQVAAFDSRKRLGGLITVRSPKNVRGACFGCYVTEAQEFQRGEFLLPTVTTTLAAIASTMAVQIISGTDDLFFREYNALWVSLDDYQTEPIAVERRPDCAICGVRKMETGA